MERLRQLEATAAAEAEAEDDSSERDSSSSEGDSERRSVDSGATIEDGDQPLTSPPPPLPPPPPSSAASRRPVLLSPSKRQKSPFASSSSGAVGSSFNRDQSLLDDDHTSQELFNLLPFQFGQNTDSANISGTNFSQLSQTSDHWFGVQQSNTDLIRSTSLCSNFSISSAWSASSIN